MRASPKLVGFTWATPRLGLKQDFKLHGFQASLSNKAWWSRPYNSGVRSNMADEESVVAEDTSVSDETTTTIDEDDFDDGESLEDFMSDDSEDSSETTDESTDHSEEESVDEQFTEDVSTETDEENAQEEDTTSTEQSSEKSQKEKAQEAYKLREAKRQMDERQRQLDQQAREQWLQQSKDEEDLKARQEFLRNDDLVTRESNAFQREIDASIKQAVADLKLKDASQEIQEAIIQDMEDFDTLYVVKDQQGRITEIKGDVYQYLQKKVGSYTRLMGIGAREQTAKKSNEKARTLTVPTRTPKEKPVDPMLDAFDEEAKSY